MCSFAGLADVMGTLKHCGLEGVPCQIAEDGSALQARLEAGLPDEGGSIPVYGLCGDVVRVHNAAELLGIVRTRNLATTLYIWELVPLFPGAPHFTLAARVNNNTFSGAQLPSGTCLWLVLRVLSCDSMNCVLQRTTSGLTGCGWRRPATRPACGWQASAVTATRGSARTPFFSGCSTACSRTLRHRLWSTTWCSCNCGRSALAALRVTDTRARAHTHTHTHTHGRAAARQLHPNSHTGAAVWCFL